MPVTIRHMLGLWHAIFSDGSVDLSHDRRRWMSGLVPGPVFVNDLVRPTLSGVVSTPRGPAPARQQHAAPAPVTTPAPAPKRQDRGAAPGGFGHRGAGRLVVPARSG
jgi:hypothetical protein